MSAISLASALPENDSSESLMTAEIAAQTPATAEIEAEASGRKAARRARAAMSTVVERTSLALATIATGTALMAGNPAAAKGLESPYEPVAANGGAELVLKEDPARNAEIKTIMERYKQGAEFEKIASMPAEQRRKIMEYYARGREAGVKDRLLATGMGSIVSGYGDIEAVRVFVSEYQKTGKMGKYLPMPYLSFSNAAEKFPEAAVLFAGELEATKKMEAQIRSILEAITQDAAKRADADRQASADAAKRADADRQASADAAKRADADRQASADLRKRIEFLDGLLKGMR